MTAPDELQRAAGNLAVLARDLERYDPWSGTRSKSDASDLRLLLSERAELLAAVERLETALIQKADEGMLVLETLAALSPNHAHRHVKEGLAMARQARAALTTGEGK